MPTAPQVGPNDKLVVFDEALHDWALREPGTDSCCRDVKEWCYVDENFTNIGDGLTLAEQSLIDATDWTVVADEVGVWLFNCDLQGRLDTTNVDPYQGTKFTYMWTITDAGDTPYTYYQNRFTTEVGYFDGETVLMNASFHVKLNTGDKVLIRFRSTIPGVSLLNSYVFVSASYQGPDLTKVDKSTP